MNTNFKRLTIAAIGAFALGALPAQGGLISHYTFDTSSGTTTITTPDEVGSAFATLGSAVNINTTTAKVGGGSLEMNGGTGGSSIGAVTSNTFNWTNDTRTVSFWWKSDNVGETTDQGTFVGMGNTTGSGLRFDIKEQGTSNTDLRVEIEGDGINSTPTIHDQQWHHVVVVVPIDGATLDDVVGYVDGSPISFSLSTDAINTATSALVFGSTFGTTNSERVPKGLMDDFQLYDEALSQTQVQSLFNNPGSVIPEPGSLALLGLGGLLVASRRRRA